MEVEGSNKEKVPDYLDKAGRRWHFLEHAKEKNMAQFVQQNGLVPGNENRKRRKFGCSWPECHFRAVFLKANSGIYTRREHRHEQVDGIGKTSGDVPKERIICFLSARSKIIKREKEEIFIGTNGKEFKLVRRFETEEDFEKHRKENWLMKNCGMWRRSYSNRTNVSTNCQVTGIYVKRNCSYYQNSQQHNHQMGKEYEDYFSHFLLKYADNKKGQLWHFLRKVDNLAELNIIAKKQMLHINKNRKTLLYFNCKYTSSSFLKLHPYPPPYCQMRAVFIKATSSIYVRNKHSHHPAFKMKHSKKGSRYGKIYRELAGCFESQQANGEQNVVPMPKEEEKHNEEEEGEEMRIVKHLQRDYKCLGRMKREGGEEEDMTNCLPVHTIHGEEEDLEEGTSQGTRRKDRGTFYRYPPCRREMQRPIKKEEPVEEALPPPPQIQPRIAIQMPQWLLQPQPVEGAQPAKMLLRERKKQINYGK